MMDHIWDTVSVHEVLEARPNSKKPLVAVTNDASLSSCLDKMLEHKLLALPIMKVTALEDKDWMDCIGIIDVKDVLQYLIKELEVIEGWTSWAPVEFKKLMEGVFVKDIVESSRSDPLVITSAGATLRSVIKFFATGVSHRCVVRVKENDFAVLSQVDVMHYLAKRITETDSSLRQALERIPLAEKLLNRASESCEVVSARMSDTVIDIMRKLYANDVSAVALVDAEGKLQANFSTSDVLHFEVGMLSDLNLTVAEFLKKYAFWALTPLAVQKEDGSLADAVVLFSALAIHRIWIVDSSVFENFAPIGIITLTDLISMLTRLDS